MGSLSRTVGVLAVLCLLASGGEIYDDCVNVDVVVFGSREQVRLFLDDCLREVGFEVLAKPMSIRDAASELDLNPGGRAHDLEAHRGLPGAVGRRGTARLSPVRAQSRREGIP